MRREALRELMANAALAKAAVRARVAATESALVRPRGSGTVSGGAPPPPAELPIPALRAPGPIRAWQARPAYSSFRIGLLHSAQQWAEPNRWSQAFQALTRRPHRVLLAACVAGAAALRARFECLLWQHQGVSPAVMCTAKSARFA